MPRIEKTEKGTITVYGGDEIEHAYFDCICDSSEHSIRVTYFVDTYETDVTMREDEIFIDIQLAGGNFWWRLKRAIKYLFGYRCKYGHWDGWTMKRVDAERFRELLDIYINSGLTKVDNEDRNIKPGGTD